MKSSMKSLFSYLTLFLWQCADRRETQCAMFSFYCLFFCLCIKCLQMPKPVSVHNEWVMCHEVFFRSPMYLAWQVFFVSYSILIRDYITECSWTEQKQFVSIRKRSHCRSGRVLTEKHFTTRSKSVHREFV